ncbi:MAG: glycosyltransferase family 4 protein [archaeon]|nr:MAG: glycosyltransferase family 4 protein [archaeon]
MRINIVHMGFFYSGGGEKVAIRQALGLRRRGHLVNVFSPIIYPDRSFPRLLKEVAPQRLVPHFPFPFPFREGSAMLASAILPLGLRKSADCDVLICHSQPSMWLGLRTNSLFDVPYVGYLHQLTTFIHQRPKIGENWNTPDFQLLSGLVGNLGRPVARALDQMCHRRARKLLYNSDWTRGLFSQEYRVGGSTCYPGVDPPIVRGAIRHNQVVMAARHYPWKRIDLAFEVIRRLKGNIPKLMITGKETSTTPTLRKRASDLGVSNLVDFTGYLDDETLSRCFAESKAYIQTSIAEPFGLGPLEAQAHGVPAVVWGDSGVKETVLDGETGFHAKPYDLDDFASKLQTILTDQELWRKMSARAVEWASSFTWDRHLDIVEAAVIDAQK